MLFFKDLYDSLRYLIFNIFLCWGELIETLAKSQAHMSQILPHSSINSLTDSFSNYLFMYYFSFFSLVPLLLFAFFGIFNDFSFLCLNILIVLLPFMTPIPPSILHSPISPLYLLWEVWELKGKKERSPRVWAANATEIILFWKQSYSKFADLL